MKLSVKPFGDSSAHLYKFVNKNGMELTVTDIGAAITSILVPSAKGLLDVALGYDSFEGYKMCKSFYGVTVGRIANRVGGASFMLDGVRIQMDKNEGKNALHGGSEPYSNRMWAADALGESVTFRLRSPDGDQGLPGAADIAVTYSLADDDSIAIRYHAVADRATVFNLTNHCYFNLDGHDAGSVADHYLWLDCDRFVAIDGEFIPTGELSPVNGTPMDFTRPKQIGRDLDVSFGQLELGNGYDHNYVISGPSLESPCARAWSLESGVEMSVRTDLPGVQFYGGNNMGLDSGGGKGGARYARRGGFCLETQFFPDSPNNPGFPSAVFAAGKPFDSTTVYSFSQR
ncbi:MAG: galactose mutarotase [Synergistaceae bacterium]|jgi:aldose 1-epimerase|nr:galactose mutarotase [Synergistaceae bacterium]